jgi:hypothetical protein
MMILPLLVTLSIPTAAAPQKGWDWREMTTPHFRVLHQTTWLPPGLTIGVESIHSRLRMDLGAFSPWMARERISLYIYSDLESYVGGEFKPPAWSNGIAVYEKKAVVIPTMKEPSQMLRIIAHETTHLLFVSYFREYHRDPPSWVNEGLAMVEEAGSRQKPETSSWYQNMVEMKPSAWFPMDRFLEINPTKDLHDSKNAVSEWYVQAYSVTHFLVRRHSNLQFKSFCSQLREGKSAAEALWLVYRYRNVKDFEKKWQAWLEDPVHKRRVMALSASQRNTDDGVMEKKGRTRPSFGSFSTDREFK